jgi:hypothetical protein
MPLREIQLEVCIDYRLYSTPLYFLYPPLGNILVLEMTLPVSNLK